MAKLFGKKQEGAPQDASVSSIPVPPSDSALVIDLPEGQKLVIGKMEEGTVIEVATWRGTGRPDSRTNRLMLGVSFGGTQTPKSAKQEEELNLSNLPAYQRYIYLLRQVILTGARNAARTLEQLKPLLARAAAKLRRREKLDSIENIRESQSGSTSDKDFDIDKWLDSVRSNSRVSKLTQAGSTRGGSSPRSEKPRSSAKGQKTRMKPTPGTKRPGGSKKSR